jgi:hypothetical protein
MSEGTPHAEEPSSVRHEPTDLSFRGVMTFYAGLAISLVLVAVGVWCMVRFLSYREDELKRSESPWTMEEKSSRREEVAGEQSRLPLLPRLEGLETGPTIQEQFRQEEKHLGEYGWMDRKAEIVHIPIEDAMKKLVGNLPARDGKDVDEFLAAPSASSSGRVPRGGER